jgi:hypothetical protein
MTWKHEISGAGLQANVSVTQAGSEATVLWRHHQAQSQAQAQAQAAVHRELLFVSSNPILCVYYDTCLVCLL